VISITRLEQSEGPKAAPRRVFIHLVSAFVCPTLLAMVHRLQHPEAGTQDRAATFCSHDQRRSRINSVAQTLSIAGIKRKDEFAMTSARRFTRAASLRTCWPRLRRVLFCEARWHPKVNGT
jgi:hypothetical protein